MSYIVRQQCKRSLLWFLLAYRAVVLSRVNSTSIKRRGCQRRTQCPHLFTDQKQILHLFHVLIYLRGSRGSRAGEFVWFWELLLPVSSLPTPPSVLPSSQNVALLPFIIIHPCTIISEDATVRDFCLCPRCILSVARRAYYTHRTQDSSDPRHFGTSAEVVPRCLYTSAPRHVDTKTVRSLWRDSSERAAGQFGTLVRSVFWTLRYLWRNVQTLQTHLNSAEVSQCRSVLGPKCPVTARHLADTVGYFIFRWDQSL